MVSATETALPNTIGDSVREMFRGIGRRLRRIGIAVGVGVASVVVASQVINNVGAGPGGFVYGPPNTPTISAVVSDTSTWHVTFSSFIGSGDDTQDSISVTVLRSGAADTLFHAVSGVQAADTISDNTDLKADTTYRVLGRQKGVSGGWSHADTVIVINTVAFFVDGFESGDFTFSQGGFQWGGSDRGSSSVAVTSTNPRTGTYSAEFTFSGGSSGQRDFSMGDLSEIWLEFYLYVPDGTEGFGSAAYIHRDGPSSDNNKLLRVWGGDYNTADNKWGASFRPDFSVGKESSVECEYAQNGGSVGRYDCDSHTDGILEADRGNWVQYRFHGKAATTTSSNDGVIQMWKDGTLLLDSQTLDGPIDHGSGDGSTWHEGYLLGAANSGFDDTTKLWIDDVRVYSADPGW